MLEDTSVAEIEELMAYMTPEELEEFAAIIADAGREWLPIPGKQRMAFMCEADITGYGGAAGGGKTDLACGLAATKHSRSIIYRREAGQLQAVIDRMEELVGSRTGLNATTGVWRLPGKRQVEFGGFPHPGDEKRYQGRAHDLKVFDEVTEMLELQVRFLMGWLRSTNPKVRQRILMTMNPPTNANGRWVIKFFAPWLDKKHPNPAKEGEIRWFTTIAGVDMEVPDGRHFVLGDDGEHIYDFDPRAYRGALKTKIIRPMSRTFIFARVTDNPFLTGDYIAKLQAMPEPYRSQMLDGDFTAGIEDDANQLIPTAWAEAAMRRWKPRDKKGPMDSIGVDVSRSNMGGTTGKGGKDRTVIARRHGTWFDELKAFRGGDVTDGAQVATRVLGFRTDNAVIHIDVVGVGTSPYDFLNTNSIQTVAVNGASQSLGMDKAGLYGFANIRSEIWWRMREALDPSNPDPIAIPDDAELLADLTAPRFWLIGRGTGSVWQVEPKRGKPRDDGKPTGLVARLGRSPDRGDALVYALISTPKRNVVFSGYAGVTDNRPPDRYSELNGGR